MSDNWKEDARFVGAFVRGGDWEVGLRIARNVEIPGSESISADRVTGSEFAREAGISYRTVARYLAAWEWAAKEKVVDHSAKIKPQHVYDFSALTTDDWAYYFKMAQENPAPWNPDGKPLRPQATPEQRRDEVVTEQVEKAIKSNPKAAKAAADALPAKTIVEKIKTDPEVEKEARKAVYEKDSERWAEERAVIKDPRQDYDDSNTLLMRMRAAKVNLQEALSLSLKTSLADPEIVTALADQIRALLTAIEGAAHGESLDDEIAALLGGSQE